MNAWHEEQHKFFTISRSIVLGMKNISKKSVEKKKHTFMLNNFLLKSCRLWQNMAHARYMLDT
jgi:hypothetical protein